MRRLIDVGVSQICVDASSVHFVDSSGLGTLLGVHKLTSAAGIPFHLRPSERLRALLQRTGLLGHFGLDAQH